MSTNRSSGKYANSNVQGLFAKASGTGGPSASGTQGTTVGARVGSLIVLKRKTSTAATGKKLSVPKPVNLPSLKKEHGGNDPVGQLVQSGNGTGTWTKQDDPKTQLIETKQSALTSTSNWASQEKPGAPTGQAAAYGHSRSYSLDQRLNPEEYPTLAASKTKSGPQGPTRSSSVYHEGRKEDNRQWTDDDRDLPGELSSYGRYNGMDADDERYFGNRYGDFNGPNWDSAYAPRYGPGRPDDVYFDRPRGPPPSMFDSEPGRFAPRHDSDSRLDRFNRNPMYPLPSGDRRAPYDRGDEPSRFGHGGFDYGYDEELFPPPPPKRTQPPPPPPPKRPLSAPASQADIASDALGDDFDQGRAEFEAELALVTRDLEQKNKAQKEDVWDTDALDVSHTPAQDTATPLSRSESEDVHASNADAAFEEPQEAETTTVDVNRPSADDEPQPQAPSGPPAPAAPEIIPPAEHADRHAHHADRRAQSTARHEVQNVHKPLFVEPPVVHAPKLHVEAHQASQPVASVPEIATVADTHVSKRAPEPLIAPVVATPAAAIPAGAVPAVAIPAVAAPASTHESAEPAHVTSTTASASGADSAAVTSKQRAVPVVERESEAARARRAAEQAMMMLPAAAKPPAAPIAVVPVAVVQAEPATSQLESENSERHSSHNAVAASIPPKPAAAQPVTQQPANQPAARPNAWSQPLSLVAKEKQPAVTETAATDAAVVPDASAAAAANSRGSSARGRGGRGRGRDGRNRGREDARGNQEAAQQQPGGERPVSGGRQRGQHASRDGNRSRDSSRSARGSADQSTWRKTADQSESAAVKSDLPTSQAEEAQAVTEPQASKPQEPGVPAAAALPANANKPGRFGRNARGRGRGGDPKTAPPPPPRPSQAPLSKPAIESSNAPPAATVPAASAEAVDPVAKPAPNAPRQPHVPESSSLAASQATAAAVSMAVPPPLPPSAVLQPQPVQQLLQEDNKCSSSSSMDAATLSLDKTATAAAASVLNPGPTSSSGLTGTSMFGPSSFGGVGFGGTGNAFPDALSFPGADKWNPLAMVASSTEQKHDSSAASAAVAAGDSSASYINLPADLGLDTPVPAPKASQPSAAPFSSEPAPPSQAPHPGRAYAVPYVAGGFTAWPHLPSLAQFQPFKPSTASWSSMGTSAVSMPAAAAQQPATSVPAQLNAQQHQASASAQAPFPPQPALPQPAAINAISSIYNSNNQSSHAAAGTMPFLAGASIPANVFSQNPPASDASTYGAQFNQAASAATYLQPWVPTSKPADWSSSGTQSVGVGQILTGASHSMWGPTIGQVPSGGQVSASASRPVGVTPSLSGYGPLSYTFVPNTAVAGAAIPSSAPTGQMDSTKLLQPPTLNMLAQEQQQQLAHGMLNNASHAQHAQPPALAQSGMMGRAVTATGSQYDSGTRQPHSAYTTPTVPQPHPPPLPAAGLHPLAGPAPKPVPAAPKAKAGPPPVGPPVPPPPVADPRVPSAPQPPPPVLNNGPLAPHPPSQPPQQPAPQAPRQYPMRGRGPRNDAAEGGGQGRGGRADRGGRGHRSFYRGGRGGNREQNQNQARPKPPAHAPPTAPGTEVPKPAPPSAPKPAPPHAPPDSKAPGPMRERSSDRGGRRGGRGKGGMGMRTMYVPKGNAANTSSASAAPSTLQGAA